MTITREQEERLIEFLVSHAEWLESMPSFNMPGGEAYQAACRTSARNIREWLEDVGAKVAA